MCENENVKKMRWCQNGCDITQDEKRSAVPMWLKFVASEFDTDENEPSEAGYVRFAHLLIVRFRDTNVICQRSYLQARPRQLTRRA
jgi:hypothetical protein